jgi:hypothetical protein
MKRMFWVDIHYACFGVISEDSVIIDTAPIFMWAKGKTLAEVKNWLLKKKAIVKEIKEEDA